MGTNRGNPALLVVIAGVALGVIFGLLGFTGVLTGRIGFGLAAVCLVVAALIYLFYSRGSVIEKTGYASLLFIVATAFILPFLTVTQQQDQLSASAAQYNTTLVRGAALFGQYCASCHGYQGQGINGPQLNNNPALAKLTPDDLRGIISGGIRNPNDPSKFLMPAWLDQFGGSLTEEDIGYLVALIQSSNPSVRATNNLANINGFDYVLGSLTNPTQIAEYNKEKAGGVKPPATSFNDLRGQASVTIDAKDDATNTSGYGWLAQGATATPLSGNNANITIKVGTKVTWGNKSSAPHTVVEGTPSAPGKDFGDATKILAANSSDSYSFTFTKAGDFPFFCSIHPAMIGWITVVAA
jgi:plastocyanin/mono/diheme cytochrome c family protein